MEHFTPHVRELKTEKIRNPGIRGPGFESRQIALLAFFCPRVALDRMTGNASFWLEKNAAGALVLSEKRRRLVILINSHSKKGTFFSLSGGLG